MNSIHRVTIPIRAIDDLHSQDISINEFVVLSSICAYTKKSNRTQTVCPPGFIMERFKFTEDELKDIVFSLINKGYLERIDNGIKIIYELKEGRIA